MIPAKVCPHKPRVAVWNGETSCYLSWSDKMIFDITAGSQEVCGTVYDMSAPCDWQSYLICKVAELGKLLFQCPAGLVAGSLSGPAARPPTHAKLWCVASRHLQKAGGIGGAQATCINGVNMQTFFPWSPESV